MNNLLFRFHKKWIFLPFTSGLVLAISFNVPSLWFIGTIGLVPLLFFIYRETSWKKIFAGSFLTGFIYIGSVIGWFWDAHPLDWAGVPNVFVSFVLTFFVWFTSSLVLALFIALWAVVFSRLRQNNFYDVVWGASLFILFEYIRAFAFSLFAFAPSSLVGAHWTFGFLGYFLAENSILLSPAGWGGVYLLSFFVFVINFSVFWFTKTRRWQKPTLMILIILVLSWSSFVDVGEKNSGNEVRVALLTTYEQSFFTITEKDFSSHLENLQELFLSIKESGDSPDIVVFPEDSRFLPHLSEQERQRLFSEALPEKEVLVIDSSRTQDMPEHFRSTLFYYNTQKSAVTTYHKQFLMPYGEYVPSITVLAGKVLGQSSWIDSLTRFREYKKGTGDIHTGGFRDVQIGALFCSEILPNKLYQSLGKDSVLLVNTASHGAFRGSQQLFNHTLKLARMRAVESNRYFVQASNYASSFIITNQGVLAKKSRGSSDHVLYGNVRLIDDVSFYSLHGDWVLLVAFLLLVIICFPQFFIKRPRKVI